MIEFVIFLFLLIITVLLTILQKIRIRFIRLTSSYNKLMAQKRSSEVRLGKTVENVAPFFTEWPYNPENFRFIGGPIDGISFNDDGVVFVEIKTGGARLSKSQSKIKTLVNAGKVKFVTFRANEKGVHIN